MSLTRPWLVSLPVSRVPTGGNLVNGAIPVSSTHDAFVTSDNAFMLGVRYEFGVR